MDCIELPVEVIVVDEYIEDEDAQELSLLAYYRDLVNSGDVFAEMEYIEVARDRARRLSCSAHVDALEQYQLESLEASHSAHVEAWYAASRSDDLPF